MPLLGGGFDHGNVLRPAPRQAPAGHGHCGGLGRAALLRLRGGASPEAEGVIRFFGLPNKWQWVKANGTILGSHFSLFEWGCSLG